MSKKLPKTPTFALFHCQKCTQKTSFLWGNFWTLGHFWVNINPPHACYMFVSHVMYDDTMM